MKPQSSGNERFGLGVLVLACTLGLFVLSQSMVLQRKYSVTEPEPNSDDTIPWKEVSQLRWSVITNKTEYKLGEKIIAECVVVSDLPYPVKIKPPVNMGATSYSEANPDEKLGQGIFITWAESEIEIPPNSTVVITSFSFRCDEVGGFVIDIHGLPETRVLVGIPPAWIMVNRVGGGSGTFREVNESALLQFPHLIESFEEDSEARSRHLVHADHMTYCPRLEAEQIIEFFGDESPSDDSEHFYNYKIELEDESLYTIGIVFSWEPPIVS
jgi:hypothetical protein